MKKVIVFLLSAVVFLSCGKGSYVPVSLIGLNKFNVHLAAGGDGKGVQATVLPSNATNKSLEWKCEDESIASVSQNGFVTPNSVGVTWVTVTAKDNGVNTKFRVSVDDVSVLADDVAFDYQEMVLRMGSSGTKITAAVIPENADDKTLVWSSANKAIATVDEKGMVTPVNTGTTIISASAVYGEGNSSCQIYVKAKNAPYVKVTKIDLDQISIILKPGEKCQLKATISPFDADVKKIEWSTDKPEIATVNNGLVSAVSVGEAIIKVFSMDGSQSASCLVTVDKADE